jgi:hypothetical protein
MNQIEITEADALAPLTEIIVARFDVGLEDEIAPLRPPSLFGTDEAAPAASVPNTTNVRVQRAPGLPLRAASTR